MAAANLSLLGEEWKGNRNFLPNLDVMYSDNVFPSLQFIFLLSLTSGSLCSDRMVFMHSIVISGSSLIGKRSSSKLSSKKLSLILESYTKTFGDAVTKNRLEVEE